MAASALKLFHHSNFLFINNLQTTKTFMRPSDGHVTHPCIIASIVTFHITALCDPSVVSVKHFWLSEVRPPPKQTTYLLFLVEVKEFEAKCHMKHSAG